MSASFLQELLFRATAHGPHRADAAPEDGAEPGVRLVDGQALYSDAWLDDEPLGHLSTGGARGASPGDDEGA